MNGEGVEMIGFKKWWCAKTLCCIGFQRNCNCSVMIHFNVHLYCFEH